MLGPEGTFTTPPYPKAHFTLKRKLIKVGRLTRRSKALTIRLHGLPADTLVKVQLTAGKKRLRKSGKVKAGKLKLKVRLTRKFRHALLSEGKLSAAGHGAAAGRHRQQRQLPGQAPQAPQAAQAPLDDGPPLRRDVGEGLHRLL